MDAEDWGNVVGQGLFEVGTIAASGGAAALAKAGKLGKLGKVASGLENLDDLSDAARALENTEDALDTVEDIGGGPRKLGEVVHKTSIFRPEKVLGRKVFKNTRDVTPGKPSFVDKSVHASIRKKINEGWTNKDLMEAGYAPIGPDGKQINLHHLIGEEPGTMVELTSSFHKKYHKTLHGLIEDGASFRNDPKLQYQYSKFRKQFWMERAKDF